MRDDDDVHFVAVVACYQPNFTRKVEFPLFVSNFQNSFGPKFSLCIQLSSKVVIENSSVYKNASLNGMEVIFFHCTCHLYVHLSGIDIG